MRLIDEKGRLFGKINLIDFLVILFLVCIIPMFYLGYKIYSRRLSVAPVELRQIELNCKFIKVKPEDLKMISVGDKEIDEKGAVIGEITWLGEIKPYRHEFDIGSGEKIIKADPYLKEVLTNLKLGVEVRDNTIYYKKNLIAINSVFNFKTDKYTVKSKPAVLETYKGEKSEIELNCKFIKIKPEDLKMISVGDKEIDEKGAVIGEITWLGEIKPYQHEFDIGSGEKIAQVGPELKEILAKLKLKAEIKDNNRIYYNNEQVLANFPLKFKTEKYTVQVIPNVVMIEEKWVQVNVKFSSLIPEVSRVLTEGDVEKNPDGKVEAILEKVISKHPSEVLLLKNIEWMIVNHPFLNDIEATFNILCREKGGVLYFKNYPVKIGNALTFTSDLYSISGTIINLAIK